jgi:hypothetical protein
MTDPHNIAAPDAPRIASVERPATGDASPNASPVARPSASPVAQMVLADNAALAELHRHWLAQADEYRTLADTARRRGHTWHALAWTDRADLAAARAYSYAVELETAEKAGGS